MSGCLGKSLTGHILGAQCQILGSPNLYPLADHTNFSNLEKEKNPQTQTLKYLCDITFHFISPNKAFLCMSFTIVKMSRHYGADSHHHYTDAGQETPLN